MTAQLKSGMKQKEQKSQFIVYKAYGTLKHCHISLNVLSFNKQAGKF